MTTTETAFAARLAGLTDDDLVEAMIDVDYLPAGPDRDRTLALCAVEVTRRDFASIAQRAPVPDDAERADSALDVSWALSRWHLWGPLGPDWVEPRLARLASRS